jgi:hypothetical protein
MCLVKNEVYRALNHAIISRNINNEGCQHVIERCASIVFAWIGRWGPKEVPEVAVPDS